MATSLGRSWRKAMAVVKMEPGYGQSPGQQGWGTIVAVIEDSGIFPPPAMVGVTQTQPAIVQPGQAVAVAVSVTDSSTVGATNVQLSESLDGLSPATGSYSFGSLGGGATQTTTVTANVPSIAVRGGGEMTSDYLQRLMSLNGRLYTASSQVTFTDANAQIYLPAVASSSSTLQIPVLTLAVSGPVANHRDLESCAGCREGPGEA